MVRIIFSSAEEIPLLDGDENIFFIGVQPVGPQGSSGEELFRLAVAEMKMAVDGTVDGRPVGVEKIKGE